MFCGESSCAQGMEVFVFLKRCVLVVFLSVLSCEVIETVLEVFRVDTRLGIEPHQPQG